MNTNSAKNLARYHARSPRYILDTEDDTLIRVAGANQIPWEEGTQIKNVSLTGLAFVAPEDLCPVLGEVIKIQFRVPAAQMMACYALVIRHEKLAKKQDPPGSVLVAVHFYKMEMPHRINLAQGLAQKVQALEEKQTAANLKEPSAPHPFLLALPFILALSFSLSLWLVGMWLFTRFSTTQMLEFLSQLI